jgi:biopolymer transport protein ExbB
MKGIAGRRRVAVFAVTLIVVSLLAPSMALARRQGRAATSSAGAETNSSAEGRTSGTQGRFLSASGPVGWMIHLVLLLMSFYLVALVVWMFLNFRQTIALPPPLLQELTDLLGRKQYDKAFAKLSADRSFLGRTLTAGVRKLPAGVPAALRAMELANDDITMEMEHHTTYLATVGTLGPMIGLIGTVYGMIISFQVIATEGSSPQASQLAGGISTALFATLEGIALSVPAIAFYALFRNRIARLSLEVAMASESLVEQFAPGVRSPHPLVAGSAPPSRAALPPVKE